VMVVPRHWREREHRYRLVATKCKICGRIYFPPRSVCPNCGRKSIGNMEKLQLSGNGTVPNEVYIGMPVRMVFRRIRQEGASGIIHYGYKFAPR